MIRLDFAHGFDQDSRELCESKSDSMGCCQSHVKSSYFALALSLFQPLTLRREPASQRCHMRSQIAKVNGQIENFFLRSDMNCAAEVRIRHPSRADLLCAHCRLGRSLRRMHASRPARQCKKIRSKPAYACILCLDSNVPPTSKLHSVSGAQPKGRVQTRIQKTWNWKQRACTKLRCAARIGPGAGDAHHQSSALGWRTLTCVVARKMLSSCLRCQAAAEAERGAVSSKTPVLSDAKSQFGLYGLTRARPACIPFGLQVWYILADISNAGTNGKEA